MIQAPEFEGVMSAYFRGERLESVLFMAPFGALCVVFGACMLYEERSGFSFGIAVPFIVLGLVLLGTGLAVGFRTPAQVASLSSLYRSDVAAFLASEMPRMQKVNAAWPNYIRTWSIFIALGVALRFIVHRGGSGVRAEWALGLGAALVFFGGAGLIIDGFAERRAKPYTASLESLRP
jgi:hypothetical protein